VPLFESYNKKISCLARILIRDQNRPNSYLNRDGLGFECGTGMARITLIFAWIVLAALSVLLIFKTNLHSDSLFLDSVMVDIFQYGGEWSNWKFTPAPAYLPDMLTYALSYFIFPSPAQRIVFVCVVQALLLAWACIHLANAIRPSFSINAKIFVLVILSFVAMVSANSSMWLFFNSTNNHFAALIFPMLCMSFIFDYWDSKRFASAGLIVFCVAAGAASTSIFVLSFTLPFLVLALGSFVLLRSQRALRVFVAKIMALILIGHIAAFVFNSAVISFDGFDERTFLTIEAALRSIGSFVEAIKVVFGLENYFTFALAIFSVAAIATVIFGSLFNMVISLKLSDKLSTTVSITIPSGNLKYYACLLFLLVAFPVNIIGSIATGGFVDPWGFRYFAFPIALGLLLWVVALDSRLILGKPYIVHLEIFLLLAMAVIGAMSTRHLFLDSGRKNLFELSARGIYNAGDAIASCIEKEAESGFVFDGGAAVFWDARGVMYKTQKTPYILPVTNDLNPYFHMMSLGPLLYPEKYGIKSYNFLIVKKSGTSTQFNLKPETISHLLPPPSRVVECNNTDSELWLYKDLALHDVISKRVARFLFQHGRQKTFQ